MFTDSLAFQMSAYGENTVFSGSDGTVFALYGKRFTQLGNITTLSYSVHREKYPVRRLGRSYPSGYTRGGRTIAGSMVFVNMRKAALASLFDYFEVQNKYQNQSILTDQLPPFDLIILFRNESGHIASMRLVGVEIADEGSVFGIDEQYIETTMQYICRDMSPIVEVQSEGSPDHTDLNTKYKNILKQISDAAQEVSVYSSHDDPTDSLNIKQSSQ